MAVEECYPGEGAVLLRLEGDRGTPADKRLICLKLEESLRWL